MERQVTRGNKRQVGFALSSGLPPSGKSGAHGRGN
jgi:hypothetical protein